MNRRLSRAATSIFAGVVLVLQAGGPTSAQTLVASSDGNGNGITDTWAYDDDGDGVLDRVLLDGDEDGTAEILIYAPAGQVAQVWLDSDLDDYWNAVFVPSVGADGVAYYATIWLDADQNGLWENAFYDGDRDGYYEWVLVDIDFDGSADTWNATVAPAGRTAADVANDQLTNQFSVNIFRALDQYPLDDLPPPICC